MSGTFNFTKDILDKVPSSEDLTNYAELVARVDKDPTGMIDPDAHFEMQKLRTSGVAFPNGFDKENQLDDWDYQIVNLIEQDFWSKRGKFPTIEELCREHPELRDNKKIAKRLERLYQNQGFYWVLEKRGIEVPAYSGDDGLPHVLSPQQLLAANFMLNLHDNRTDREKLKELGISSQKWTAWVHDPVFADYLRRRAENLYGAQDYKAYAALIRAIDNNDFQAIKLFFEMRGIHNPKMEVNVNINQVMTRVVEVIQLHVRDPETLNAIADDLAAIEGS